jgi:alpha-mannosidase
MRRRNPLPQLVPSRLRRTRALVDALLYERSTELPVLGGSLNVVPVGLAAARRQRLRRVVAGERFGPPGGGWHQRWFRVAIPPAPRAERGRRGLHWRCQGETTVYHRGVPWAGLDVAHRSCPLPDASAELWLDCSTWQTGLWLGRADERIDAYGLRFDGCALRVRDALAWRVRTALEVLEQLVHALAAREGIAITTGYGHAAPLESCSPLLRRLLGGLDHACDAFAAGGLRALERSLAALARTLPAEAWQPVAGLCGHAHLDLVWLWPELATERKGVHTFATQLRVLERYPEVVFVQSQPALYRAVARRAPALWREVRSQIRAGRWEVVGGFEVEPDTTVPCGEALARSLVIGQRSIGELRGTPSRVCWLPDVFGYSTCLPQILRLGGVEAFFTTKLNWSAVSKFPYTSFVWRGSDGSEVLAHLCPTTYNGRVEVAELIDAARAHRQADVHAELLLPTGFGDGGGGMTETMAERARVVRSLAGVPRARWTTVEAFFRRLAGVRPRLPVYQGELYLEYHRGTYTTQAECKRRYRAAERALQAREAVRAATRRGPIDEADWRRVLFAQFHDAVPGSSIGIVYAQLNAELAAIADRQLAAAHAELGAGRGAARLSLFNPLPLPRRAVVEVPRSPHGSWCASDGTPPPAQASGRRRALVAVSLPPLGALSLRAGGPRQRAAAAIAATADRLDNGLVAARFARGALVGLRIDGRPLELAGAAGFALFHDQPANFDAWDIDHYTLDTGRRVAVSLRLSVVERGAVRARLRGTAAIGARSRLTVDYVLDAGARLLRVEVEVDWRESNRLLKFLLPTGYRGRWARYGTPFGSIQRPQLGGVAADEAMWEVPGSRWAAVTHENGEGLAVCTAASYGFSCRDGELGVSLLRSPKQPDPQADMGVHRIACAVGRYAPRTRGTELATAAEAEALDAPVLLGGGSGPAPPFAWEELGSLVPCWVAPLARGYVIRLHEVSGGAGLARLRFTRPPRAVDLVDFMDRRIGRVRRISRHAVAIAYRPYQIVGLRVTDKQ